MLMSSLSPSLSQPAGRISQVLPTINCSSCNQPVPLAELGDHICAPAPPLPTPKPSLNIPKPVLSPNAATSLLPQRLQSRVNAPVSPQPPSNARSSSSSLRLNTNGSTAPSRSSPLSSPLSRLANDPPLGGAFSRTRSGSSASSNLPSRITDALPPPVAGFSRARSGSSASSNIPSPVTARPSFSSVRQIPPPDVRPPPAPETDINTQIGGEAGMAGVGRRGFAAAARAAMFASAPLHQPRADPPRNLDIGAATIGSRSPPPLSTDTGSSNSPGLAPYPESPISPQSYERRRSPPPLQHRPSASVSSKASSVHAKSLSSVSQSSGSEYGLAYADSTDYEDEEDEDDARDLRLANELRSGLDLFRDKEEPSIDSRASSIRAPSIRKGSDSAGSDLSERNRSNVDRAPGPSQSPPSAFRQPIGLGARSGHSRASSSGSAQSAYSSRSAVAEAKAKSSRGSDRDDSMARPSGQGRSTSADDAKPPAPDSKRVGRTHKTKVCVRCEKKIDDGKWVQMDGGRVLCETCWKNMYLPKCRRCNLPIEKQAVSSSDGQLKGKYHRECFNCHICHKPFPDKTFYVHDSKPLCAYHYHEANDSLCAAARCGQPIEGPCAVSHAGDRYHPEHMLCEYPGGCKERLEEYWEVDGRMLCERHSRVAQRDSDEEDDDGRRWQQNSRAMKRVTRYIDLANGR